MPKERPLPTPEQIIDGLLNNGRSPEQIAGFFGLINHGIHEGTIRAQISCWEYVKGFFNMAVRRFVHDDDVIVLSDAELGIHQGSCKSPVCARLTDTYFGMLRGSQAEDGPSIHRKLRLLALDVILGKPRPDLEGKKTLYYDSLTGEDLITEKAVEITDKCIAGDTVKEVILSYFRSSDGMIAEVKLNLDGHSDMSNTVRLDHTFKPQSEGLLSASGLIKMDSELLHAIIIANRPRTKLLVLN